MCRVGGVHSEWWLALFGGIGALLAGRRAGLLVRDTHSTLAEEPTRPGMGVIGRGAQAGDEGLKESRFDCGDLQPTRSSTAPGRIRLEDAD